MENATQHSLHFTDLLQVLKLRRRLLYLFTALAVAGTIFRQVFYVPLYTADTRLNIQKAENSPMQMALANLGAQSFDNGDRLKKYLDYLQSMEFYLAVAETLKFEDGYNLLNLTEPGELALTKKKFWVQFVQTHFGRKIADTSTEAQLEPVLVPVEKLAQILRNMTTAEGIGSDTIRFHVTSLDPFTSMVLANTATQVFVKKTTERDFNEVTEVKRFIEEQLDSTTERLKRSESTLVDFKKRHNIISITKEQEAFSQRLGGIETDLEQARIHFNENQKLIDYYERMLAASEKQILSGGSNVIKDSPTDVVNRLRQQLDSLRYKKVLMQAQSYAEGSWQMTEINHDIDQTAALLKAQLEKAGPAAQNAAYPETTVENTAVARTKLEQLKLENKELDAKIQTYDHTKGSLLKNLETLPKDEQAMLTLTRDVDLQFELYSSLKKKLQEVEIQQVALQSHVSIMERSGVPGPNPRTNFVVKIIFALLVGLFLGCVTAFLLEAIDPTVKHPVDLEKLEMVTLGSIPHVEGSPIRSTLGVHTYRPDLLICKEKPESPESMAFKHVRAQITMHRGPDGNLNRVFVITSPERGDGKSFISSNLAVSLASLEKKTLLIDCDFRNPSIPWLFGYKESNGLSSLLTLKSSLDEVLIRNLAPHLDILPAGWSPSNPSELISNDKFRVLLEHLKLIYDYIVIDAPPAVAVVDASVLASLSDCVIMAACFRKTKKDMMLMALRKILQVSHRHVYALLNDVWEIHEYTSYVSPVNTGGPSPSSPVDARAELERFEQILTQKKAG